MLVDQEEVLMQWSQATHEELREIVRLWMIVKPLKEYGNGSLELVIRDGNIVKAESSKTWMPRGNGFGDCDLI